MFHLFLQLCLAALTFAAPLPSDKISTMGNAQQMGAGGGVVGFIILILDIMVWSTYSLGVSQGVGC